MDEFIEELVLFKSFSREICTGSVQDYSQEYRLYFLMNPNGSIAGYAMGETHCGHGKGCFWTNEEISPSSLEEFNAISRICRKGGTKRK